MSTTPLDPVDPVDPLRPQGVQGSSSALGRWRPRGPWALAAVGLCGCAVVLAVDPRAHTVTPPCPMQSLTGWWCPLCGGTRAVARLLHGDLASAWRYNALVVSLLPLVALMWLAAAAPRRLPVLAPLVRRRDAIVMAMAAVGMVFMVVRNTGWGIAHDLRLPGA